jgi:DNA topoisomerase IA
MRIAEKLYTQGFISYPRTETNIFPPDFNVKLKFSLIFLKLNKNILIL